MATFGKRSLDSLKGIHPKLVLIMQEAIKDTPIDFTIIEGVRTVQRQQDLYAQGRTKSGPVVTFADGVKSKSNHQLKSDGYGYAVDLYPFIDGKIDFNNVPALKRISDHIKAVARDLKLSITWGGDWKKPYDPPHFQL